MLRRAVGANSPMNDISAATSVSANIRMLPLSLNEDDDHAVVPVSFFKDSKSASETLLVCILLVT